MPEGDRTKMGGTMRLGARTTLLAPGGVAHALYAEAASEGGGEGAAGVLRVDERHRHRCVCPALRQAVGGQEGVDQITAVCRHNPSPTTATNRYEVNPDLVPELEAAGLRFTGRDETGRRMEVLELAPAPGDDGA